MLSDFALRAECLWHRPVACLLGDEVKGRENIEVDYFYDLQIAFLDYDHVAGERLRSELWPPNGPTRIVHPLRDI